MHRHACTYLDAAAIVGDLEEFEAAVLDQDFECSGASIDRVLNQFLQSIDRGNNDLSCGDLVDNVGVKSL